MTLAIFDTSFFFLALSFLLIVAISPILIFLLRKLQIVRRDANDFSSLIAERKTKAGTPIMGGLAIVFTVTIITILFNWNRESTYVPIGVFLISAILGGADDLLNLFYTKQRLVRTLGRLMLLIRHHKNPWKRFEYAIFLPWHAYKRFFYLLGSHPGKGIQAHEKILVQLIIGIVVAWWLADKLAWTEVWFPWIGSFDFGLLIIPIIIFLVMFMANAVNITDGIDGLSAGTLLLAFSAYFVIALQQGADSLAFLIATFMGALVGYLLFNIKPAKYQMGDVASLGLGVVLAAIAFALDRIILLPLIGGIFFIEILSVIFQLAWKVLLGKRLLAMAPLHHHLEIRGWSEATIVMYAWTATAILSAIAIWLSFH